MLEIDESISCQCIQSKAIMGLQAISMMKYCSHVNHAYFCTLFCYLSREDGKCLEMLICVCICQFTVKLPPNIILYHLTQGTKC